MSPRVTGRVGRGNPAGAPAAGLTDRYCSLKTVLLFAEDLIYSEGSTTSSYFDRWCQIRDTAAKLLDLLDRPQLEGLDSLAENWARLTFVELQGYFQIDVLHELLARRRQIAHVWSVEDVLEVRPDLDEDQAWQVLQLVDRNKDATIGITWETLEAAAEALYPEEGGAA